MASMSFKDENTFEKRKMLSDKILTTYSDRVPVIVERSTQARSDIPEIDRKKFLTPSDITVAKFQSEIRKHISIPPSTSIFLFVSGKNIMPQAAQTMDQLHSLYKDEDGFLYIEYSGHEIFG